MPKKKSKYKNHGVTVGRKMTKSENYCSVSIYEQFYIVIVMVELLRDINSHKINIFSFFCYHHKKTLDNMGEDIRKIRHVYPNHIQ